MHALRACSLLTSQPLSFAKFSSYNSKYTPTKSSQCQKDWLWHLTLKARRNMTEWKSRYEKEAKKSLLFNEATLTPGNFIFVSREYKNKSEKRNKLQHTADCPFQIITADATTVTVCIDSLDEKSFRDRLVEATLTTENVPLLTLDTRHECSPTSTHSTAESASRRSPTQKHVVERIISHALDASNDTLYQVRWYDCGPKQETWEPIQHLSCSHVVRYNRRKNLPVLDDIHLNRAHATWLKKNGGKGVSYWRLLAQTFYWMSSRETYSVCLCFHCRRCRRSFGGPVRLCLAVTIQEYCIDS